MPKRRANGEGNIRKRKDGRWEGRYTAGYDANGKAITKNVLGKTQAEVKDKLRAAIEDNKKLDPVKAGSYTLEQWLRLWYSVYIEPQVRYSTKEFYHNAIDHHIIPKLGNVKLERLTMLQIQQFYNELLKSGRVQKKNQPELKEHGLSPRMVQCVHVVLSKALEYAVEEKLILADVGGEVAVHLVDKLRDRVRDKGLKTGEQAADALRDIIAEEMTPEAEMALDGKPAVILVIGVNGVGKTTSIAKLADYYTRQGKRVMLAAGDTFRAAASEQLEIWAGRAGVPIVSAGEGADPAAVIFDTVKSATARGYDMVIADTAGRLHNKSNLMAELSKISRSVKKASPEASLETLLVLDAITGQNAISQAKEFCKAADATGIILTKLDGTAKGGCVVAVKQRLGLPVRFIGVGEGIDDLLPFTPEGFVEELLPREWKH